MVSLETGLAPEEPLMPEATPAYLMPCEFNMSPGPEYADEVRQFQGVPSIGRAANGRLWAVWYGGGITENRDNYVMAATSSDDGETWSDLKFVLDPDGPGPVRTFDAVPWLDPAGRLWLFWSQSHENDIGNRCAAWGSVSENAGDEDPAWSPPRMIGDGVMMNRPTVLADGTWLLPIAHWHHAPSARVFASSDGGETFALRGGATLPDPAARDADEHMIVERRDGTLWMLVRTGYGIGESVSADGGRTWTTVAPCAIRHVTSRFHLRRLRSGRLLLVKHGRPDERGERCDLTAHLSDDDGATWHGRLVIDERVDVSYPDAVESCSAGSTGSAQAGRGQGDEGLIYLIYDFKRFTDKEILLARFTEQDVIGGAFASARSATRLLVNKAYGKNPQYA